MLVLSRKPLEQIQIGENITVTVLHVKGKVVKLGIDAPRNMRILRTELMSRDEAGDQSAGKVKKRPGKTGRAGPRRGTMEQPCDGGQRRSARGFVAQASRL